MIFYISFTIGDHNNVIVEFVKHLENKMHPDRKVGDTACFTFIRNEK